MVHVSTVAGGVPASVWGFTDDVAQRLDAVRSQTPPGHSGMGTTLSANALSLAAMRATLEHVMTAGAYAHMKSLAARLAAGLQAVVDQYGMAWHVVRVGLAMPRFRWRASASAIYMRHFCMAVSAKGWRCASAPRARR
jgi:glutamate-1-semialdehyde aminotransferase